MGKVMNKSDDMLGIIVIRSPMEIEQSVEMMPFKFFSENSSFFLKTIRRTFSNETKSKLREKIVQRRKDTKDVQ